MSIKNLFGNYSKSGPSNKDTTIVPLTSLSGSVLSGSLESERQIVAKRAFEQRVIPPVDFSKVENFARFGSAEEYYTNAITHIYSSYPYDGSLAEKQEWHNQSSDLENYVFNYEYPRATGFANFSPGNDAWGSLQGSKVNTFGLSDTKEFIQIVGGPHTSTRRPGDPIEGGDIEGTFKDGFANVWDPSTNRKSNLQLNFSKGVCVEFWLKKDDTVSTSKTEKEIVFDLWNESYNSSTYGRCMVYAEGGTIKSLISSGSSNFSIQSDGSDVDGKWHHHAFVWKNTSTALQCEYYKDGEYVKKATHSALMGEIAGTLKANIGAARRPGINQSEVNSLAESAKIDGYGKLSGSIDEFRYWTKSRDAREIGRNFWTAIHGATQSDLSSDQQLGLYFKFNEGNTGNATFDKVVLDYSGRISNGTWTVEGTNTFSGETYRSLGSAINTASAYTTTNFSGSEFKDPILRQTHPSIVSYKAEKILSSSYHDSTNGTMIYNTLPSWVTEQDIREDGELKKLCQIMASYLDTLYMQIHNLPKIKHAKYVEDITGSKPYPFMKHMLSSVGFRAPDLFTETTALHEYFDRDENRLFESSLTEVKNLIYRNIYNNISYIYKTKGTEKSFRNLIRCFGIDDEIYKLNSYGQNQVFELKDRYQNISVKRNYVDFYETTWPAPSVYNKTNATVYLLGDAIPGIATGSGHSFTYECEMRFPRKIRADEDKYVPYDDVSGSIFGIKTVPTSGSYTEDSQLLNVWFVKQGEDVAHAPPAESEDVVFYAQLSDGTTISTPIYKSVYEDEEWFLSVGVEQPKKNTLGIHKDSSESGETGLLRFTGINTAGDYVASSFVLTSSISNAMLNQFLTSSKRPWLGAKKLNFLSENTTQQITDVKIGSLRGWLGALSYDESVAHARDAKNYGRKRPLRNSFLLQSGSNQNLIPSAETCIFNWAFDDVSTADAAGQFEVKDASSGSASTSLYEDTETNLDNLLSRKFEGRGEGFPPNQHAVDRTYVISAKHLPPEVVVSSDQVNVMTKDDINFTRASRPRNIVMRLEKSMYQVVSEDMLNMFAGVEEFNNLIGEGVNKYRQQYKGMELLRRIYFDKLGNTPDVDKFLNYYKWMDDSLSQMLRQVLPMSADVSEDVGNVIESHILERNKYLHKFPTMEFKQDDPEGAIRGIEELKYPWRFGHAAIVGKNKFWSRERQTHSNTNREAVRQVVVTETSGTAPTLSGSTGAYSGDEYARRSMLRSYEIVVDDPSVTIGSEEDRSRHIDGPSRAWNQSADSRRNFGYHRGLLKFGEPSTYIEVDLHQQPHWDLLNPSKVKEKDISLTKQDIVSTRAKIYRDGSHDEKRSLDIVKSTDVLPFTIQNSPEISGGYRASYWHLGTSSVSFNNMHEDRSGNKRIAPLQGPFTEKYVGGLQYRHQNLNIGAQDGGGADTHSDVRSRGEGWELVNPGAGAISFTALINEDWGVPSGSEAPGGFPANWYRSATGWNIASSQTPTANTGPSGPHSNSYYVHAEATSIVAGESITLTTPNVDGTEALSSAFSGSFYYHMYGADMGTLQVQAGVGEDIATTTFTDINVTWDVGGTPATSTILAGQQQASEAASWKKASFSLSGYAGEKFFVRLKYTKGLSNTGDLAIDLFKINLADIGEFSLRDVNHFTKHRARSALYRDEVAKRPVNIKNIRQLTASALQSGVTHNTTIIGNYSKNYEVVHTNDSLINNYYLKKTVDKEFSTQLPAGYAQASPARTGLTSSVISPRVGGKSLYEPEHGAATSINENHDTVYPLHLPALADTDWQFIDQDTVPDRSLHSNKSIIVNRFSAPGDSYTSRRASLDAESEQLSPHNALPWRNHRVRAVLDSGSAERFDGVSYIETPVNHPSRLPATATLTVANGTADISVGTIEEKGHVTITSTDGTTKRYVIVHAGVGMPPETGTVLTGGMSTGNLNASGDDVGGIAVNVRRNPEEDRDKQNEVLVQLKAAIEHSNGHNGKIIVSDVPAPAGGVQSITLTQSVAGEAGNVNVSLVTPITENITHLAATDFTGGNDGETHVATLSGSAMSGGYQHKIYKNPLCRPIPAASSATENLTWSTSAAKFEGNSSNDQLICGSEDLGAMASVQSFSFSVWINKDSHATRYIAAHGNMGNFFSGRRFSMLTNYTSGTKFAIVVNIENKGLPVVTKALSTNSIFEKDTWYHVGFTWNLPENALKIFSNGEVVASEIGGSPVITALEDMSGHVSAKQRLVIGNRYINGGLDSSGRFDGHMDEISFWGRTLSEEEFRELYSPKTYLPFVEGTAGPADLSKHSVVINGGRDALLGWWRMGDGTHDTAATYINQAPISLSEYPHSNFAPMTILGDGTTDTTNVPPKASFYSLLKEKKYDNRFVSHQIPRTSRQYSWITASLASHDFTKNNVSFGFFEEKTYESLEGEYTLNVKDRGSAVGYNPYHDQAAFRNDIVFGADETSFPLDADYPTNGDSFFNPRSGNPGSENSALQIVNINSVGLNTIIRDPISNSGEYGIDFRFAQDTLRDAGVADQLHNFKDNTIGELNTLGVPKLLANARGNYVSMLTGSEDSGISVGSVITGSTSMGLQTSSFAITGYQYSNFALGWGYLNWSVNDTALSTNHRGFVEQLSVGSGSYFPFIVANDTESSAGFVALPIGAGARSGYTGNEASVAHQDIVQYGPGQENIFNSLMIHRNGPYGYPSWKQTRTGQHPVVRYLNKNNIFSVYYDQKRRKDTVGSSAMYEDRSILINISQSSISSRSKPLTHLLDVNGEHVALKHSYANNLCGLSSQWLNRFLGYENNKEQVYEQLYSMYAVPENLISSPIRSFMKLKYKELVFPREMNVYQKRIRSRIMYSDNEAGYRERGIDASDSSLFWRDDANSRFRNRHLKYNKFLVDNPWVPSKDPQDSTVLGSQVHNAFAQVTIFINGLMTNERQITIQSADGTSETYTSKASGSHNFDNQEFSGGAPDEIADSLARAIGHNHENNALFGKLTVTMPAAGQANFQLEQKIAGVTGQTTITSNLANTVIQGTNNSTSNKFDGGTGFVSYPERDFVIVSVGGRQSGGGSGSATHMQKIANLLTGAMSPYENYWAHDVMFHMHNETEKYTKASLQTVVSGTDHSPTGAMGFAPNAQEQLSVWPCDISENVTNSKITGSRGVLGFDAEIAAGRRNITASFFNTSQGETLITASFSSYDAAGAGAPSPSFGSLMHPSVYTPSDWRRDTTFDGSSQKGMEGGQYLFNYQPYCGFFSDASMIRRPHCNMYRNDTILSMEMKPSTVHDIRGRGPFYDSYEEWSSELKFMGQDYSILPEFRISEHIEYYVKEKGGDFFAKNLAALSIKGGELSSSATSPESGMDFKFYRDYSNSDFMQHFDYFVDGHEFIGDVKTVSLTCRGIKKLLPYNGFYPSSRIVQLSQIFSSSYDGFLSGSSFTGSYGKEGTYNTNTNSVESERNDRSYLAVDPAFLLGKGGYLSASSPSHISAQDYGDPFYAQRLNAFWQPLISPGVLLNSIKAGIAVDYPVATAEDLVGRGPGGFISHDIGIPLGQKRKGGGNSALMWRYAPELRIPFEAVVDQQRFMPKTPEKFEATGSTDGAGEGSFLSTAQTNGIMSYALTTHGQWSFNNGSSAQNGQRIYSLWDGANVPMFEMAAHNFVSEVPTFFLAGNGALTTFASMEQEKIKPMRSGSVYYMDVVIRKTEDLVTTEGPRKSYLYGVRSDVFNLTGPKQFADLTFAGARRGCVYGPPVSGGVKHLIERQYDGAAINGGGEGGILYEGSGGFHDGNAIKLMSDPAYAPWTPPYFYGRAVARISFDPARRFIMSAGEARKFTFEEIFAGCDVEYFNEHYMAKNDVTEEHNPAIDGAWTTLKKAWMQNSASLNLFQISTKPVIDVDPVSGREQLARNAGQQDQKIWTISTKWECPVLDFSLGHQDSGSYTFYNDHNRTGSVNRISTTSNKAYTSRFSNAGSSGSIDNGDGTESSVGWTLGSGSCRALWNTYGEVPSGSKGLYLSIEESHPLETWGARAGYARATPAGTDPTAVKGAANAYGTGSLAYVCGFQTNKEKIGQMAHAREVSELVVAVPYLTAPTKEQKDTKQVVWSSDFRRYFFRINGLSIGLQLLHKQQTGNALPENMLYDGSPPVQDTSVTDLADKMEKYVFPPNMDFMKNKEDIKPFVMYTFEFNSVLDQEDLSDIWQGVMPKLAMKAEKEEVKVTHTNASWEFFNGKRIPSNVKWMVFKVKKRAKTNYYDLVDDAQADTRFKFNFNLNSSERKSPNYSYNWPYDYFSLVELGQLESEIVIEAKKNE